MKMEVEMIPDVAKVVVVFNRNPIVFAGCIQQPSRELIQSTLGLFNASVEDALKYGGDLTRAAIGAMRLQNDRKYVVVDTKVHMLMPGFMPAIPSWHTDGAPRGIDQRPDSKGAPDVRAQEGRVAPRFHLLVTGEGCLTEFIGPPIPIPIPSRPTTDLYRIINERLAVIDTEIIRAADSCRVVEFDWWNLHRGVRARVHEWRFLVRVTETDDVAPQTDLRKIIRTQQQVYIPESFGW